MNDPHVKEVAVAMLQVHQDPNTPDSVRAWLTMLLEKLDKEGTPDHRYRKGDPLPQGLGAQADEYSFVREERLRVQKIAEDIKARETEIFNTILSTLDESTDTGASGKFYRVQRIEKDQMQVKDWPAVWDYIQKTGAFDMLQKRLNEKAVKDMVEGGDVVPGVEAVKVPTLSFRKVD